MNQESACLSPKISFKIETIPLAEIPGQSKLFLDFQSDSPEALKYYPEKNTPLADFAAGVLADYETDRDDLCDALREINQRLGAGAKTLENIEMLRRNDCVAVVTGQQAGLFSGALYTVYKALSAVKLADDLRRQNVNAVPVFWVAEEDHDFDEVKKTFVIDREGKLASIENAPLDYRKNSPVGAVRLDETIGETIEVLFRNSTRTAFTEPLRELLTKTYRSGETYADAFGKLIAEIFRHQGLIILSPLNQKLKELSAPVLVAAIKKSDEIRAALLNRTRELKTNGYHAQVLVEEDYFSFFRIDENGARLALKRTKEGNYKAKGSTQREITLDELVECAEKSPVSLSPNALMRPVVQDYLLPTVCYFGGAAEIAYFAQNAGIYRVLNRPATPIRHRASFTVVEAKHARTLGRYDLKFAGLFAGQEKIFARVVEKYLADGTAKTFAEVEEGINTQLNRLDRHLLESEPTLSPNLAARRRKIMYHIGALRKKFYRAEVFKDATARRRIETLFTALLPHNALQERTLNVAYFLNLYGENFVEWLAEAVCAEEKDHQLLYL